jgi:hypothetical protein
VMCNIRSDPAGMCELQCNAAGKKHMHRYDDVLVQSEHEHVHQWDGNTRLTCLAKRLMQTTVGLVAWNERA